jgi:predicted phosphodiesterase
MYLNLWLAENEHFPVGNMDSQRISELLPDKLLLTLAKLKLLGIDGHHILRPVTKEQRELFPAFSLPSPFVG